MSEITYPYGYGTTRLTMADLRAKTEPHMHPAYARRVFPALEARGGEIGLAVPGCGGGLRYTQPLKPGFAPPGMSFHERQKYASGLFVYAAWDLVVGTDGRHRAPTWAETEWFKAWGLHTFISGEPWHLQCIEQRGYTTWVNAGRPDPAMDYPLPTVVPPPYVPPMGSESYNPPTDWWLFPLNKSKPTVREGDKDDAFIGHVRYLQDVIYFFAGGDIARDGDFGPQTKRRVMDLQSVVGAHVDGVVGPQTWGWVDWIVAERTKPAPPPAPTPAPTPPPPSTGITSVSPCKYYVRKGDSPWAVGERVYGSGKAGAENLAASMFTTYSLPGAPVFIDILPVKGVATEVRSGEGPYAILARMGVPAAQLGVFYDWNGGEGRVLHPGDVVHMPTS